MQLTEKKIRCIIREAISDVIGNNEDYKLRDYIYDLKERDFINNEIVTHIDRIMANNPNISLREFLWSYVNKMHEQLGLTDEDIE